MHSASVSFDSSQIKATIKFSNIMFIQQRNSFIQLIIRQYIHRIATHISGTITLLYHASHLIILQKLALNVAPVTREMSRLLSYSGIHGRCNTCRSSRQCRECLRNQREVAENALTSEFHAREVVPIVVVL